MKKIIFFLLLSLTLFGCCKLTDPDKNNKTWTFMMYLDGDEISMQQDFIAAFYNMIAAEVGSNDEVNIVIQFDRIPHMDDFGGWEIAHRFYYTPGMEPTPENAIADWGDGQGGREVNMADPETLQSFITWTAANYPADHYALMLADHGYGWQGMMIDETSDGDFMTVKGVVSALQGSGVYFNLLALNACVMQMIEVMHELRNTPIDIVVGSENLGTTWPLTEIIQTITDDPFITAEDLGKDMNDLYYAKHSTDSTITQSTLRLDKIPAVVDAVQELVETILDTGLFSEIQKEAVQVMYEIDNAIVYMRNGSQWESAGGLTIYWPPSEQGFIPGMFFYSYIDEIISFAADNPWREFLYIFYNVMHYQGIIEPEIYHIYQNLSFLDDDKIDLYDFCKRIVEYEEP